MQSLITRNGYRYRPHISYHNLRYFQCEDLKTQGCKGVWKIFMGESENEEHGTLHIDHSIILEHHRYYKEGGSDVAGGGCVDIAIYN
jgi:hypothetical protein